MKKLAYTSCHGSHCMHNYFWCLVFCILKNCASPVHDLPVLLIITMTWDA